MAARECGIMLSEPLRLSTAIRWPLATFNVPAVPAVTGNKWRILSGAPGYAMFAQPKICRKPAAKCFSFCGCSWSEICPCRTNAPIPSRKALAVNLESRRYGTFAEIGAGQEVVRWFFRVGGAAGTIAKSMSAYDMTVSDAIYGPCDRYVCRQRLESMLDHEQALNLDRLRESRGDTTAFFVFADTVSARNFKGTNECHGWMGVRFQAHPRDQDSQIILHVRMLDTENALQQEALGIVGVNLLYGAFFLNHEPDQLIESLLDDLTTRRIEIDMIEFSGIAFRHVDNRVMSLRLVQLGLSGAAMFSAKGEVLQPSEVLYKKPILVERGSFRPVTHVNIDMLRSAHEKFAREREVEEDSIVSLMEITMRNLQASGGQPNGEIDLRDFLARADMLAACGKTVLISDYFEYYRLAAYLTRYTKQENRHHDGGRQLVRIVRRKILRRASTAAFWNRSAGCSKTI